MSDETAKETGSEIAVIGMAARFPGASSVAEFWDNLKIGKESISFLSIDEATGAGASRAEFQTPGYVKATGGILEDREFFDPFFFGFTPKEAEIMDPQARVLHQCVYAALEDAGYVPGKHDGFTGLYVGAGESGYWEIMASFSGAYEELGGFSAGHLMNKDYIATRIAYNLDLKGPCFMLQTACSTSLVAIHLACQGILDGECDMAAAGGVRITSRERTGYTYREGTIISPDGHCRAFDARSKGMIDGEGCGVVLLKSLEEAISDRDHIYAVIKGTAINNDGLRKVGYTAPSIKGQAEVIRMAHRVAEIEPESVVYIEAHGTGTELGDPVEIEALKLAFDTPKKNYCAVGSVKSNVGHMDTAAGVTGFIKAALVLKNRLIPPSLHFESPNPKIDFENSPFYVNHGLTELKPNGRPLRAGVSAFGIGGTNAHVVLEQPHTRGGAFRPPRGQEFRHSKESIADTLRGCTHRVPKTFDAGQENRLILLSGKTPGALDRVRENLVRYLQTHRDVSLPDLSYTLMVGREDFEYKKMVVCRDVDDAIEKLSDPASRDEHTFSTGEENRPVIFMFPGQDSYYVNMGRELYLQEPVFREAMDRCFEILRPLVDYDLKDILYPASLTAPRAAGPASVSSVSSVAKNINQTAITRPLIFAVEYALAHLLMKWGIKPSEVIGSGAGEYAAACTAGILSLEDALKLMLSIGRQDETKPTPSASQPPLQGRGFLESTPKHLPAHSPIGRGAPQGRGGLEPEIPYTSGLTGHRITTAEIEDPSYWVRLSKEAGRVDAGIKELLKKAKAIFIEVGPGCALSDLTKGYADGSAHYHILDLLKPAGQDTPDNGYFLDKIGQLWLLGHRVDRAEFYSRQKRRRISLPTYPFEKQYYWIKEDLVKKGLEMIKKPQESKEDNTRDSHEPGSQKAPMQKKEAPEKKVKAPVYTKPRPQLMNPYIAPTGAVEEEIAREWESLLAIDKIGIGDDFFELGGDSVKAVNMATRVSKMGYQVGLNDILSNPTVKKLAGFIADREKNRELEDEIYEKRLIGKLECIERLNKGRNKRNIFLIHPNHGMVNQYKKLAELLEGKFNVYGVVARGTKPGTAVSDTPKQMLADYIEQITAVHENGPFIIGGYCGGAMIAFELVAQLEGMNKPVEKLILFDSPALFADRYVKTLKLLSYLPGFTKKIILAAKQLKFKKAIIGKKPRKLDESALDDGSRKKEITDYVFLLANYILPSRVIKAPVLAPLAAESNYERSTEADYRKITESGAKLVITPGSHNSIYKEPNVHKLAELLLENV